MVTEQCRIIGLIRFSVLVGGRGSPWNLGKGESYEEILFSRQRLEKRFEFFERLTLPSLDQQTSTAFTVALFCSDRLPERWRQRLDHLAKTRPYLRVVEHRTGDPLECTMADACQELLPSEGTYATFRLDDDDALHNEYIARLGEIAAQCTENAVVSFDNGIYIGMNHRGLVARRVRVRCLALGLAYVSSARPIQTIHHLGSHAKLKKRQDILVSEAPYAWLRTKYEDADSVIGDKKLIDDIKGDIIGSKDFLTILNNHFPSLSYRNIIQALSSFR